MRLLSLDYEPLFGDDDVNLAQFESDISVFDYDLVIWDPSATFERYTQYADNYQGLPSLSDSASADLVANLKRRRSEFSSFLTSGNSLVIMLRGPQECYVATGTVGYSGTGRNSRKIRHVDKVDLMSAVPVTFGILSRARGDRIEVVGDGAISRLLRKYISDLEYTSVVAEPKGTVTALVKGTDRAVAIYLRVEGAGHVVGIPATRFEPIASEDEEGNETQENWPIEAVEFQADLVAAIAELSGQGEVSRPAWAENYGTALTHDAQQKVIKQVASIERARKRLSILQESEEKEKLLEQLYLGSGRQLELQVRMVLELLGGKIEEPDPGRADWRVTFDAKRAVLEIKGLTKSAGEKDAAQLEKWVAEDIEKTGTSPKGILIVNTWRDTPLAKRTKEDFPAQMLPYSRAREHCLVTGLELFVIASIVRTDSTKALYWRNQLITTIGRISGVPDWREFLLETLTVAEDQV